MRATRWASWFLLLSACDGDPPANTDGGAIARTDGAITRDDAGPAVPSDGGARDDDASMPGTDAGMPSMPTPPRPTGTVFLESHYEAESEGGVYADSVGEHVYVPGGGVGGSNAWEIHLFGDQGNEDSAGWTTVDLPANTTQTLFVGYMLYVSAGMIERMQIRSGDARPPSGKMHDAQMHPWSRDARQVVTFGMRQGSGSDFPDDEISGIAPALLKGGAGGNYTRQRLDRVFDLRDYADQWIWIEVEMNAEERYTAVWVTTPDGLFTGRLDEPLMYRSADDTSDWTYSEWVEEPYVYFEEGWQTPGLLWGYWDDLEGVPFDEGDFVRLDDLYVSDAFIEPPIF
jgi:hypothetical protein